MVSVVIKIIPAQMESVFAQHVKISNVLEETFATRDNVFHQIVKTIHLSHVMLEKFVVMELV